MEDLRLPFREKFATAWNEWLQYRKEGRLKKYVPTGLKKTFTMLRHISGDDEETAIKILSQSMEQGWQGLFPLKKEKNATHSGLSKKGNYQPTGAGDY
jgi:hypothetical protein